VFDALVRGESPHQAARTLFTKKLETTLSYGENPESLSHLSLIRYLDMAPKNGQTDRQTGGQTELRYLVRAKHYVLSRVKTKQNRMLFDFCTRYLFF